VSVDVAGIVAVHSFPLDIECVLDLLPRVQALVLWIDQRASDRKPEWKALIANHGKHLQYVKFLDAGQRWRHCSGWIWREPLMRALDDIRPAYVLQPDSDEKFGPGFDADLQAFRESKRDLLFFDYAMPTDDGSWVPTVPKARHVKVIRWKPGLSFLPYRGYGKPNGQLSESKAQSKILHYCFYSAEIQRQKCDGYSPANHAKFSRRLSKAP
jgi:hypothetical protein